jgi:hypothetical protein
MALAISNLSLDKDLDQAEMSAVRGGSTFVNGGANLVNGCGVSFGSPVSIAAPVTQVDASSHSATKLDMPTIANVGGVQWAHA